MENIKINKIFKLLGLFLLLDLLSFTSQPYPGLSGAVLIIFFLITAIATWRRVEYGLLIVFGELFSGSLGHLFSLSLNTYSIPLRIALWSAFLSIFIIKHGGKRQAYKQFFNFSTRKNIELKLFALVFLFIVIALVNGLLRGHELAIIFSDFNAWLYFLLLFPVIFVYQKRDELALGRLKTLLAAAALYLSLKTLTLLFIFTHDLNASASIYTWLRKTLSGEMTMTKTGWPRIFIQGQVYVAIAWLALIYYQAKQGGERFLKREGLLFWLSGALFFSAILISFSRSFWVGIVAALAVALLFIWRRFSFKTACRSFAWFLSSALGAFALLYLVAIFPYPAPGNFRVDFLDRISNGGEAALSSRWSLLPVLIKEIKREPFFGQGYGSTITYLSQDPRVLMNNPDGHYTTYAFEWAYLDIWLKIGLFGLLAYLGLIGFLISRGLSLKTPLSLESWAMTFGLLFLSVINIFTPYLNHPLGIGFLLLAPCLILRDRVY